MKNLKTKVLYCGGSLPVPSHLQKGIIEIRDGSFFFRAKGKSPEHTIDIRIPTAKIKRVVPEEKKFYSSVGYFLRVAYVDDDEKDQEIEMEIRCFIRRGRTQALMNHWVEMLSPKV